MKTSMKSQQGYLIVLLITIIVVLSFVGVTLAYIFTTNTISNTNTFQSNNAFYVAASGVEKAKHDIIFDGKSCDDAGIPPSNYANQSLFNGQYTITATAKSASTKLNGSLCHASTNIKLTSASQLSPRGYIIIGSELIYYPSISGNTLQNVMRGASNTTAASYSCGTTVYQKQCTLTATGGSPIIASPEGKRVLQEILPINPQFSIKGLQNFVGQAIPTIVAVGTVAVTGSTSIINPAATYLGTTYPGSNIISGSSSPVVFNGNAAKTQVTTSTTNSALMTSSKTGQIRPDIQYGISNITTQTLFGYYFSNPKATVKASADLFYNSSTMNNFIQAIQNSNNTAGKTIWVDTDVNISGNGTIGTPTNPTLLIINGNANISGTVILYGFLYATQGIALSGNVNITGAMASENAINISGNATIKYDAGILSILGMNGDLALPYAGTGTTQEIFN